LALLGEAPELVGDGLGDRIGDDGERDLALAQAGAACIAEGASELGRLCASIEESCGLELQIPQREAGIAGRGRPRRPEELASGDDAGHALLDDEVAELTMELFISPRRIGGPKEP